MKHILLGDFGQSLDGIETAKQFKVQAKIQRRQAESLVAKDIEIARLKGRTERLHLAITALTRFMIEKEVIREEELAEFIAGIDAEDGSADGKLGFENESVRPKLLIPKDKDAGKQA